MLELSVSIIFFGCKGTDYFVTMQIFFNFFSNYFSISKISVKFALRKNLTVFSKKHYGFLQETLRFSKIGVFAPPQNYLLQTHKHNSESMAKVKYKVKEYNPSDNQPGTHSFYANVVISNEVTNTDLADLVAARTGYKSYECQSVIAAVADIIKTQMLFSNRVTLCDEKGVKILALYPKVQGSVSDADIERITTALHASDPSIPIRTRAEASDLTADKLNWTVGSTVGVKFSKQFALDKKAQRVDGSANDTTISNDEDPDDGNDNGNDNGNDQGNDGPPPEGGGFGG